MMSNAIEMDVVYTKKKEDMRKRIEMAIRCKNLFYRSLMFICLKKIMALNTCHGINAYIGFYRLHQNTSVVRYIEI